MSDVKRCGSEYCRFPLGFHDICTNYANHPALERKWNENKISDLQFRLTAAETRVKELEQEVEKTNVFRSRLKAKNRIAMDMIAEYQAELDKLKGSQ